MTNASAREIMAALRSAMVSVRINSVQRSKRIPSTFKKDGAMPMIFPRVRSAA